MAGRLTVIALPLLVAAMPSVAYAAGSNAESTPGNLGTVVLLVMVIGAAYVLAHNVVERLQHRFLVVSGAEYLLLGVLLGPTFPAIDVFDNLTGIVPIIAFASGGAYFLELSPLAVNLSMGFVLVNFARGGHLLHSTLESTERPMALVLMIFAGALWEPTDLEVTLLALAGFLILRTSFKWLASLIASWGTSLRKDLFRGLLAHGDVTLAMAVSFRLVYQGGAADLAYSVVLGSIIVNDLLAPRLLRGLLADEGEIQRELRSDSRTSIEVTAK